LSDNALAVSHRPGTLLILDPKHKTDTQLLLGAEMRNAPTKPHSSALLLTLRSKPDHVTASRPALNRSRGLHLTFKRVRYPVQSLPDNIKDQRRKCNYLVCLYYRGRLPADCRQTSCLSPLTDTCTPTQGSRRSTRLPF